MNDGIGRADAWVALDWNGQSLAVKDAPARQIMLGDGKPSRWVHRVRTLKIVNLAPKGHGPAPGRP